jgi:hypothetical protein
VIDSLGALVAQRFDYYGEGGRGLAARVVKVVPRKRRTPLAEALWICRIRGIVCFVSILR